MCIPMSKRNVWHRHFYLQATACTPTVMAGHRPDSRRPLQCASAHRRSVYITVFDSRCLNLWKLARKYTGTSWKSALDLGVRLQLYRPSRIEGAGAVLARTMSGGSTAISLG